MKKTSIRHKMSSLTVRISLISVIVIGIVTITGLWILRDNTVSISGELGDTAAGYSRTALEERMTDRLLTLSENTAALSDSYLRVIQNSVEMMAQGAEDILNNPDRYLPNPVAPPNAANSGILTAQFLRAESADMAVIEESAALMGNIEGLLLNILTKNIPSIQSCIDSANNYVGSELGYLILVDSASDNKSEFFDPRTRPWYKLAVENNRLSWSDVYPDAYGRGLAITCAMPYYEKNGRLAGVAGIGTLLTELTGIVTETRVGETGYAFMLNEAGHIIISHTIQADEDGNIIREDLLGSENPDVAAVARNMIDGKSGIERIYMNDKEYFIAYSALEIMPWSLATVIEVSEAVSPAIDIGERIIGMKDNALHDIDIVIITIIIAFIVIIGLSVLLVGYASRRFADTLTKPIIRLQDGVRQIADGNLEHTIEIITGDEIEDLGQSVNKMAIDLKNYISNLQTVTAEKERIGAELDVATKIQLSMLPTIFPPFPQKKEFDLYACMHPAKEVGGDFYDFFLVDDNTLAVVMADVSGKGVPAALFMVIAKTLIKNNAQPGVSPKAVFEAVNNILYESNDEGMFVTVFLGYLDIQSGRFSFVNAGHNPPLICRDKHFDWLVTKPDFVLAGLDDMIFTQHETTLEPGDELLLYTDGMTEAVNNEYEMYSETRLIDAANDHRGLPLREFLGSLEQEVNEFAGGAEQSDDITMLALRYKGAVFVCDESQITIKADIDNLIEVQDFVSKHLDGYPPKTRNQIAIAVDEIFSNIAFYAYAPGTGNVTIKITALDALTIEFENSGVPFDPLSNDDPDITLTAEDRDIGGLGIFMVKNIMDSVEYRHDGEKNILTVKKYMTDRNIK